MTEERSPREHAQRIIPRNLKQYYLGLLTKGERWNIIEDREAQDLLPMHLAFLRQQIEEKQYVFAGPVNEETHYVGMMMIEASSKEEAFTLAQQDPGIKAKRLSVEMYSVLLPALDGIQVRY